MYSSVPTDPVKALEFKEKCAWLYNAYKDVFCFFSYVDTPQNLKKNVSLILITYKRSELCTTYIIFKK